MHYLDASRDSVLWVMLVSFHLTSFMAWSVVDALTLLC